MNNHNRSKCPRCHEGKLLAWKELNDDERVVAHRLPASADCSQAEREATHRWCTKCWYETESKALDA